MLCKIICGRALSQPPKPIFCALNGPVFAGASLKIHVGETELADLFGWVPIANHWRLHSEVFQSVCLINGPYFADLRLFILFLNLLHIIYKS